jgi:glycosyltransferase involved in cell wall biosynthesis
MIRDPAPGVMQLVLSLVPGGTERLTVEIARRLSGRFRMSVCCLDERGAWASEVEAAGVPVTVLNRRPGFHPSLGLRVAALASRSNVEIIHCHHFSPFVYGTIATMANRRVKLVFTEHGRLSDAPPTRKRRIVNAILGRLAGPSFAVAYELREHMVAEGFPASRLGVIHNGIDIGAVPDDAARGDARRALGLDDDAIVVGTVARLDPVKDLQTLIAAIADARARVESLLLVIVGDGPEREALQAAARQRGVTDAVRFTGYSAEIRRLLPGFDIYANSSVSEGISLTILEAMAAALPVVATRVGGTPEVVVDGSTGLMVSSRSPQQLADAISDLAALPAKRRALGMAGRARVEASFSIDRMVEDYAGEYERLLGREVTAATSAPDALGQRR